MTHELKNSWGYQKINGVHVGTVDNSYSFDLKSERDYFASQAVKQFPKVNLFEIKSGKKGQKKMKYFVTTSELR